MAVSKKSLENLVPASKLTKEQRIKNGRKGAEKTNKKIRERKQLSEVTKALLNSELGEKDKARVKKEFNLDDDFLTYRFPLILDLYNIARSKDAKATDRLNAIKMIAEYAGEDRQAALLQKQQEAAATIEDDPFSKAVEEFICSQKSNSKS